MLHLGNQNVKSSVCKITNGNPFADLISKEHIEKFNVPTSVNCFLLKLNKDSNNVDEYVFNDKVYISSKSFSDLDSIKLTFNNIKYIGGLPNTSSSNMDVTYNNAIEMSDELKLLTDYQIIDGTKYMYDGIESLRKSLFQSKKSLVAITLPSTIKSIGDRCFQFCTNLQSIDMGNCSELQTIGGFVFDGCKAINNYDFSKCTSLTDIGTYCFRNNIITSIDLSGCTSLKSLGDYCFEKCSNLNNIRFSPSITTFGNYCFDNCTSLESITLPQSLTYLGTYCFDNCSSLSTIVFPSSFKSCGGSCFRNCPNLTSIDLSPCTEMTNFESKLLLNSVITTIILPSNLIGIDFESSNILHTIDISNCNKIPYINDYCFRGCSQVSSILLPPNITYIGSRAFQNCSNLTNITIPNSVTTIGDYCFNGCSNLTNIVLPNSLLTIDYYCFLGCTSLTNITIPSSVTSMSNCFTGCYNLTTITINKPEGSISGAPWGATNATVIWNG